MQCTYTHRAPPFVWLTFVPLALILLQVVLTLLGAKSGIRKAEIVEAVQKANIDLSETACMRAVKEICQSQGTSWKLKT